jgi:hypothetical protein
MHAIDLIQIFVSSMLKYLSNGTGTIPNEFVYIYLDLILGICALFI